MFLKISRNFKKTFSIFAFSLLIFAIAAAALAVDYVPLVNIPGFTPTTGTSLTGYLFGLYNFLISIVGILAMAVIIYGGMRYVVSAGNPAAMEDAKEAIWSAVYGLALALGSWLIINVVNPDILVLKNPGVGWPIGRYSYDPGSNIQKCSLVPSGMGTEKDPCVCADEKKVTFTQPVLTGPYVVKPSIEPCTTGISSTTSSVTFTFNEPLKLDSIITDGPSPQRTVIGPYAAFIPLTNIIATTNGKDLIITWPGATLDATKRYGFLIKGKVNSSGESNSAYVTNESGAPMARDYFFEFTPNSDFGTSPCTPPLPPVITCPVACSNPSTPDLNPAGYHCAIADLKAGTSAGSINIDDTVNIKAGETVYFDAKTYSRNFVAPNFNVDVRPSTDSKFHNGVDSYIIKTKLLAGDNPKWKPDDEKLQNLRYDYFYTVPSSGCSTLASWATGFFNGIIDMFGGSNNEGMITSKYDTAGEYKAILNIYAVDGNGVCQGPFIDRVYVNVNKNP